MAITRLPIYDKQTYRKIQAFVWLFNAYDLLEDGNIPMTSPFSIESDNKYLSIKQYKDFLKLHKSFAKIYPDLLTHSVVHQLGWEI